MAPIPPELARNLVKSWRWVVVTPDRAITRDNHKIKPR